ncbi:MAG TPA: phosphotransferase family protein [Acidimicrobiia bacterium]|jgi:aminoglycoside phosphotransferase (APT) family kinase protein
MALDVDLDQLAARLAPAALADLRPLTGGASSLTYCGTRAHDGEPVVVKMAPPGVPPVLNRDVLRQARLLRALHGSAVPVPEVLWEDAGDPPDVPPLFVMSYVEGTSLEPLFDRDGDDPEPVVAERMRNAARTMAALHALDPSALGLADEPVGGVGEEVDRWCRSLETVDPALAPGWQDVADALHGHEPPARRAAVVHGDFRLGNLLASGGTITAVVDWEIWSVADPRLDVGWFLVNADPDTYGRATRYAGGLPSPDELAALYSEVLGEPLGDDDWFRALALFKSTATWSLIVKHNRRRTTPDPDLEALAPVLPRLLARATALVDA